VAELIWAVTPVWSRRTFSASRTKTSRTPGQLSVRSGASARGSGRRPHTHAAGAGPTNPVQSCRDANSRSRLLFLYWSAKPLLFYKTAVGVFLLGIYTMRSSARPIRPTAVGPTIVPCKRFIRQVGSAIGRIKHV